MILSYNLQRILWLYGTHQLPAEFINPAYTTQDHDKMVNFILAVKRLEASTGIPGRYTWAYYDRSGTIPSPLNVSLGNDNHLPIYNPAFVHKNYLELCLDRANQLFDTGKQLNILWSGGLDSTVILFSMLDQCKNPDQLNIICTFESIMESGSMFDRYVKNSGIRIKFDQTRFNRQHSYTYDNEDPNQLYITGNGADQLFGLSTHGRRSFEIPGNPVMGSWKGVYNNDFISVLEPTFEKSPRPVETVRDMLWWLHFNFFWTTTYYDEQCERLPHVAKRIVNFYGTPEFQQWAVSTSTYHEKIDQYRWPAKQALAQLVSVPYYVANKKKVMSHTWTPDNTWYMIDVEHKNYFTTAK